MSALLRNILILVVVACLAFAAGYITGSWGRPELQRQIDAAILGERSATKIAERERDRYIALQRENQAIRNGLERSLGLTGEVGSIGRRIEERQRLLADSVDRSARILGGGSGSD